MNDLSLALLVTLGAPTITLTFLLVIVGICDLLGGE